MGVLYRTWSAALSLLEQSTPSTSLSSFLSSNLSQLRDPANPFPSTSTTTTALTTTKQQLSKFEEAAAAEVGERFTVAKTTAEAAVKVCTRRGKKEGDRISEEEWERITAWMFEERMSIIGVASLLLRIRQLRPPILFPFALADLLSLFQSTTEKTILVIL